MDIKGTKLEHALEFGATHLVNGATEDVTASVRDITRGEMANYAFEVIGNLHAYAHQALHTTRRGGVTVVVGVTPTGARLTIDPGLSSSGPGAPGVAPTAPVTPEPTCQSLWTCIWLVS